MRSISPCSAFRSGEAEAPAQTECGFLPAEGADAGAATARRRGGVTRSSALAISSATWPSTSPMKRSVRMVIFDVDPAGSGQAAAAAGRGKGRRHVEFRGR